MRKVKDVLPKAIGNDQVLKATRAQLILKRWPEVVGTMMAERSHPDRFSRGTVWVAVQGSAWAQELRMMKEVILTRLNAMSDDPNLFVDVRFGVRSLPNRSELVDETAEKENPPVKRELTIREIAERRLARWKDEGGD